MQVVVLTPHLSYSPLIHQYICLFTMSSFGSKSDPQQTTGALNCASICIFNIGIFALRSLEESQRRGERGKVSWEDFQVGRMPRPGPSSWIELLAPRRALTWYMMVVPKKVLNIVWFFFTKLLHHFLHLCKVAM